MKIIRMALCVGLSVVLVLCGLCAFAAEDTAPVLYSSEVVEGHYLKSISIDTLEDWMSDSYARSCVSFFFAADLAVNSVIDFGEWCTLGDNFCAVIYEGTAIFSAFRIQKSDSTCYWIYSIYDLATNQLAYTFTENVNASYMETVIKESIKSETGEDITIYDNNDYEVMLKVAIDMGAEMTDPLTEYDSEDTIEYAQTALNKAGYSCGTPDGVFGKNTKAAITQYQTDKGLTATGTLTHETLKSLGYFDANISLTETKDGKYEANVTYDDTEN